jgi:selenocysteine lyase/cysteine desulfurase
MGNVLRAREHFRLTRDVAQFATFEFASHPRAVSEAIKKYRDILDKQGYPYFRDNAKQRRVDVLEALKAYFGVEVGLGAITHATTVGLADILGGVRMLPQQEFLISSRAHPATLETLQHRFERDRTPFRRARFYARSDRKTGLEQEIVDSIAREIRPATRVLVVEWVSACDGLKLPIARLAALVAEQNAARTKVHDETLLLFVDGVHGFGIENTTFPALDCDFFVAGCHKSIFGPRGTAVACAKATAWPHVVPMTAMLSAAKEGPASPHTPGGVHTYEHWWALKEAFEFHLDLGKAAIERRVRTLASSVKRKLKTIRGIHLVTPVSNALSSGLVCFDVLNRLPGDVVTALEKDHDIIASVSPPDEDGTRHVRLAVSILNDEDEIRRLVAAVRGIARESLRS